jgi:hypothetical protein
MGGTIANLADIAKDSRIGSMRNVSCVIVIANAVRNLH